MRKFARIKTKLISCILLLAMGGAVSGKCKPCAGGLGISVF